MIGHLAPALQVMVSLSAQPLIRTWMDLGTPLARSAEVRLIPRYLPLPGPRTNPSQIRACCFPSPRRGYRYDGLFMVEEYWQEIGKSGFGIWRYRLRKLPDQWIDEDAEHSGTRDPDTPPNAAPRRHTSVLRIVRDTRQARGIKKLYDYRCQMCGIRLEGFAGPYAEAAHVRPLGSPHNGPDTPDNILCLCPNHHVLFDHGGVSVGEDMSLIGAQGRLTVHPRHRVSEEHLRYRRKHYRVDA